MPIKVEFFCFKNRTSFLEVTHDTNDILKKNLNSHQIKTHVNSSFSNVAKIRPFRCIQVDFLQNSAMKKSRDYQFFFFLKRYFFVESNVIFTLKFRENSVFVILFCDIFSVLVIQKIALFFNFAMFTTIKRLLGTSRLFRREIRWKLIIRFRDFFVNIRILNQAVFFIFAEFFRTHSFL